MAIRLSHIFKAYDGKAVLSDVSLDLAEGGSYCLMGPSGQGKTTLLHILMGLVTPDSGTVTGIAGHRMAPVFQEDRLCENLSVRTNIRMAAREKLIPGQIEDVLERLGLLESLYQPVRELSGGMKRRVAIARALLSGGDVYIFDEPFKGLDEETRRAVMDLTREFTRGKTLIWVTHDPYEADYMGSTVMHIAAPTE